MNLSDATKADAPVVYVLRLFVVGVSPISARAIVNLRTFCETHLKGNYDLEIIDLAKRPEMARVEQIYASPTLVKKSPLPVRRCLGDMSMTGRLLEAFDLPASTHA